MIPEEIMFDFSKKTVFIESYFYLFDLDIETL